MKNYKEHKIFLLSDPLSPRLNPSLAVEIGLNESILLLQIEFWTAVHADEDNKIEISIRKIQRTLKFWSVGTIHTTLKNLEKQGLITLSHKDSGIVLNLAKINELESVIVQDLNDAVQDLNTNCSDTEHHSINKNIKETIKSATSKNSLFGIDTFPYITAKKLADYILSNNPKHKPITEKELQDWAKDIDKCCRLDGRSEEDVTAVLDWCQKDDFWYKNILSANKLRIQFDKLYVKMMDEVRKKRNFDTRNGEEKDVEYYVPKDKQITINPNK